MDLKNKNMIKGFYSRLEELKKSNEIVNDYGMFDVDAEVLGDFMEFFYV